MKRKITSIIIVIAMTIMLIPAGVFTAIAEDDNGTNVVYMFYDENTKTFKQSVCPHPTLVQSNTTTWKNGWYVASGEVEITERVLVTGDVYLILKDGCKLTVNGGINVDESNSFTVLAQSAGTGELIAVNENQSAGIGGGNEQSNGTVVIHGGIVTATGNKGAGIGGGYHRAGGTVIIYCGTVTANSSKGAGIGGGYYGIGGTVEIYGGNVTASGGDDSAGIGGGCSSSGGRVTINGGRVTATGGCCGAGIGCGSEGAGGTVTINGGTVTATGGENGAGISDGYGGTVTVNGGIVTANGGRDAAGIFGTVTVKGGLAEANGNGKGAGITGSLIVNGGTVRATGPESPAICCTTTVNGGNVIALGKFNGAGIGGYHMQGGVAVTINGGTIFASSKYGSAIGAGLGGSDPGTISVNENVRLINLEDGTYFTKNDDQKWTDVIKGSTVLFVAEKVNGSNEAVPYLAYDAETESFTEEQCKYGDFQFLTQNMTELSSGTYVVCSIMAFENDVVVKGNVSLILTDGCEMNILGSLTVNEGDALTVYAQSAGALAGKLTVVPETNYNAGIGGSNGNNCGTVTINGGIITATGKYDSAGIGGGKGGAGGTITINGGTVTANGSCYGAGIGGSDGGDGGTVTITGGTVTATGGENGAGIGCGKRGDGGTVTISGGTVTATGGDSGAGIGGGGIAAGGTVTITGGTVTANGGYHAAGIGGGEYGSDGGNVKIIGGTVTANGGTNAAGIGGGNIGDGSNVTITGGTVTARGNNASGIGGGYSGGSGTLSIGEELSVYNDDTEELITRTGEESWTEAIGNAPVLITEFDPEPEDECVRYLEYKDGAFIEKIYTGEKYFLWSALKELENNRYIVEGNVTIDDRVLVTGDVKLILTDGCTLKILGGIEVNEGNSLTVYAQSSDENMGKLIADASEGISPVAGIGSWSEIDGGTVIIHGGNITARGGSYNGVDGGAGIGSGAFTPDYYYDEDYLEYKFAEYGSAGNITIYGGIVTANGGYNAAGIGGGSGCDGGTIKIYGGTVKATGDNDFTAGIGYGAYEVESGEILPFIGSTSVTVDLIHDVNYDLNSRTVEIYGDHADENNDGICDICKEAFTDFAFNSKSLALNSVFAFRFKGYLRTETPADDAYMEFKVGKIRTVDVPLAEAETDTEGRKVFTCLLDVLEVDEKIEAIFHNGEDTFVRKNPLSVTDYLDQVETNHTGKTGAEDVATLELINAISNYAHYAQAALDESHDNYTVGNKSKDKYRQTEKRTDITVKTSTELAAFAATRTVKDGYTAITKTSRSLVLDDETAIIIYLTPADKADSYTPVVNVTKGGNDYAFICTKQSDGRWKLVIPDIAASELADVFTVDIDKGGMAFTNLSALSYAHTVLASESSSTNYKYAVSALYDYYLATNAYITVTKGE